LDVALLAFNACNKERVDSDCFQATERASVPVLLICPQIPFKRFQTDSPSFVARGWHHASLPIDIAMKVGGRVVELTGVVTEKCGYRDEGFESHDWGVEACFGVVDTRYPCNSSSDWTGFVHGYGTVFEISVKYASWRNDTFMKRA
jgi:hypothetical protein